MSETTADERKVPWRDSRTTVIRYRNAVAARLSRSRKQTKVSNAIAMPANKHCAAVRQDPWVRLCFIELLRSGRIACLTSDRHLKVEINGARVDEEILSNRTDAIVTRRDAGKSHFVSIVF